MTASSPVYQAVSRARMLMPSSGLQDVSDPADRVDEPLRMTRVHLAAEETNVRVDHIAARLGIVSPHPLLDRHPAEDLAWVPHQEVEQLIFAGGELHGLLAAG